MKFLEPKGDFEWYFNNYFRDVACILDYFSSQNFESRDCQGSALASLRHFEPKLEAFPKEP